MGWLRSCGGGECRGDGKRSLQGWWAAVQHFQSFERGGRTHVIGQLPVTDLTQPSLN